MQQPVIERSGPLSLVSHRRSLIAEAIEFAWLLADQGIFAATNFVVNILFARWLAPIDYGMFAVSFSGYLLLTVLHFGAVLEPILVQSAQVAANRLRSYIGVLIVAHILMIGGIGVVAVCGFIGAIWLGYEQAGLAILGAMLGGSLMVTLLSARRLCLVFLSARHSAIFGIVYLVGVVLTTFIIRRTSEVAWFDPWLVMGGWSLLCSAILLAILYSSLNGTDRFSLTELCRFQWQYARYGMVAAVCSWIRVDGVLLLLAQLSGLEVIARTRAVLNIANPLIQINLCLYTSWLVIFSKNHSWQQVRRTATVYCATAIVVLFIVYEIAEPVVHLVYKGRYHDAAWLLPVYCVIIALNGVESVFTCFMKAIRYLKRGYAPQIIGALISVGIGVVLIPTMQEAGAIYAIVISFSLGTVLAFILALG